MTRTNRATAAILSSLALSLTMASARPLLAATPSKAKVHGISLSGRVSKMDAAAKTLTVRDGAGREVALAWTAATKITGGDLKVGEVVTLRYLDKDKTHIATTIQVGPVPPAAAATAAKTPAPGSPAAPHASPSPATSPSPTSR